MSKFHARAIMCPARYAVGMEATSSDPITRVSPLGQRWQTTDPFLFCVHHIDRYPKGNDRLGPAAPLTGHNLGQDFDNPDGWNMYHGDVVPGFPQHPHRGFETVTIVRTGYIDHSDSLGATARFGMGDVQWLTAGKGHDATSELNTLGQEGWQLAAIFPHPGDAVVSVRPLQPAALLADPTGGSIVFEEISSMSSCASARAVAVLPYPLLCW